MDTQAFLNLIFNDARTHSYWQDTPVNIDLLKQAYELARMGPTAANCCPMRITFVISQDAKARLKPHLDAGNVDKTMKAPATAIIAYDMEFYEQLPKLFPHTNARAWFAGKPDNIAKTTFRNGSLQGAYFMIAARSLGLDCGPMSGFNSETLDKEFFAGTSYRSNFLCNLGYGDASKLHPRSPRLSFEEACEVQ